MNEQRLGKGQIERAEAGQVGEKKRGEGGRALIFPFFSFSLSNPPFILYAFLLKETLGRRDN